MTGAGFGRESSRESQGTFSKNNAASGHDAPASHRHDPELRVGSILFHQIEDGAQKHPSVLTGLGELYRAGRTVVRGSGRHFSQIQPAGEEERKNFALKSMGP